MEGGMEEGMEEEAGKGIEALKRVVATGVMPCEGGREGGEEGGRDGGRDGGQDGGREGRREGITSGQGQVK
jgi:hypothetical protein